MSVIADRLRAAANAAEEVVSERDALLKERAELLSERDDARSSLNTAADAVKRLRAERDEARTALAEQEEISTRLHHEMTALSGKLAQWTGGCDCGASVTELAELLRDQRDELANDCGDADELLTRAVAAIPCTACGQVGDVHEVDDDEDIDPAWRCVDSKACNERATEQRSTPDSDTLLGEELAVSRGLRKQVDTLAKENLRLLGELHAERDNHDVEFDDAARNNSTLYAELAALNKVLEDRERQIANQQAVIDELYSANGELQEHVRLGANQIATISNLNKSIDVLAKKNADLAAELERRPSERIMRNLTLENARLRSKLGDQTTVGDSPPSTNDPGGPQWAHVEIMGHREHYGRIILVGDAESGTLRRVEELDGTVHYYGPGAIFAIHPCTEAEVRKQTADPRAPAQPGPAGDDDGAPF